MIETNASEAIASILRIVLIIVAIVLTIAGQINWNEGHKTHGIVLAAMGAALLATMLFR